MTTDEAIAVFSSYSREEKKEFLARLIYELTIVTRDSYEVRRDGLSNPERVRRINEIQHRASAFLWALLCDDERRYPDEILIKIVLEQPEDDALARQINEVFARLTMQPVSAA